MDELDLVTEEPAFPGKLSFEPSDFYNHQVLKFKVKYASGRDKVQGYLEANEWWERDRLIQSCHGKEHLDDKSREGRKLNLAGYYKKMKHTPL